MAKWEKLAVLANSLLSKLADRKMGKMSTYIDPSCLVPAKKWEKLAVLANSLLSKLADRKMGKMSTYIDPSCLVPAKK
jgi:hypothetical protein